MLLVGDLGFGVVTDFARCFPQQFLNVGVAEQNMAGVATGLALSGRIVFTYSIANFPILRCLEQLRNDVCYHQANVISVSVGGGFSYGALGMTHHGTEDIAIMRSIPYMKVIAPGDPREVRAAVRYLGQGKGPAYLRLGRAGEPNVHQDSISWELGRAITVRDGHDATLISTGAMLDTCVKAAELLAARQVSVRILSMHTVKPIDQQAIQSAVLETGCIISVEEHSELGGLGGAVAEVLCRNAQSPFLFRQCALPSEFAKHVGSQQYLRHVYGLTPESITQSVMELAKRKNRGALPNALVRRR